MKTILSKCLMLVVALSIFSGNILTAAVAPASTVPTSNPTTEVPSSVTVKDALKSLSSLSRAEKKAKIKEVKKELKEYKKLKKSGAAPSTNKLLLVILAILLPPLAVYLHQGEINNKFWISLLLTLLFFLPGVIYALLVIFGEV